MSSTWFPFLPSWLPSWLFVLIVLLIVSYQYFTWDFSVFKSLGIKGPTPYPLLGTMLPMIQKGLPEHDMELKKKYGKIVGTFQGRQPIMMIYDTDILKQILIKDFTNFTNRFSVSFGEWPLDLMITGIKDDHWKHVRNILTPTFSSGKLRKMNTQVNQCAETLCNNLDKMAESKETFDLRSLCGAYTMDVIASTAFSVKIDSHNNPENQFVRMAKKAFNFQFDSPRTMLFFFTQIFSYAVITIVVARSGECVGWQVFVPVLMRPLSKLGFSIFPRDVTDFFVNATNQALENRENEKKSGTDFLQIMINAHLEEEESKGKETPEKADQANGTPAGWAKKGLTRHEVVAQSLLFFLAGYETTANTLSLLGYHLAVQPEIQEKLYKEIQEVTKGKESVNSDMVQEMTYLDMCVNETLRMYPAGPRTDRVATNDVVINGVFIPKGMTVGIPIYALQNDPELWEEPEKFNPDRFRPEKRDQIDPMHFMPFGVGPRHCVGMRLALMEMKMSVVHILQTFKLITCSETQIPLQLEKLSMKGVNGIKLRVEKR